MCSKYILAIEIIRGQRVKPYNRRKQNPQKQQNKKTRIAMREEGMCCLLLLFFKNKINK